MRPTWDQLINGSADSQYAELQGIITSVETNTAVLFVHGGKIRISLPDLSPEALRRYQNSLVHIRGCLTALWNAETHQVKEGEIRILNATISSDAPNSADLFASLPLKKVADLLRFDLRASAFQSVKISGQMIRREGREYSCWTAQADCVLSRKQCPKYSQAIWWKWWDCPNWAGLLQSCARRWRARPAGLRCLQPSRLSGKTSPGLVWMPPW